MARIEPVGSILGRLLPAALILALVAVGCGEDSGADDALGSEGSSTTEWQPSHEFGRWTVDPDGQILRIEWGGLVCDQHRVLVVEEGADEWLIQFEATSSGDPCPAVGCQTQTIYSCVELTLERPIPDGVRLRAVCDPAKSVYATATPGQPKPVLGPTGDGTPAVACSPEPEPAGVLQPRDTPRPPVGAD